MTAPSRTPSAYSLGLGARLKAARQALGLSQFEVERKSGGRWKAVVAGSYERGDRHITAERLVELAEFYGTDPAALLTGREPVPVSGLVAAAFVAITKSAAGTARQQILDRALRELGDGDTYQAFAEIVRSAS